MNSSDLSDNKPAAAARGLCRLLPLLLVLACLFALNSCETVGSVLRGILSLPVQAFDAVAG